MTDTSTPLEEHRFPCTNCGATLQFDPGDDQLICSNCGNTQTIDTAMGQREAIRERDYHAALNNLMREAEYEETRVVSCPNCSAQTEFAEHEQSKRCPFCDTPVVTDTGTHRHIKPSALLPFTLEEKEAREAMGKWMKKLWFAPGGLKEYARAGRPMNGIYVPYWTYDADSRTDYTGQRGTHYYETKTVTRDGKREQVRVRKTRWRNARGRVQRWFDDVLVLASKSLPKRYTDALEPWDLDDLVAYQPEYLAGLRAEGYQVELTDGFDEARNHMDRVIRQDVKRDIGGDEQRVRSVDTRLSDITFKHILLPIWLAAYKYNGKTYRFVVNARNGKVKGERPYSIWKIAITVIVLAILIGIAIFFAVQAQDGGTFAAGSAIQSTKP